MEENFLYYIEHSIRIHWEEPALTDYQGQTHTFGDVAHHIARLHLLFEAESAGEIRSLFAAGIRPTGESLFWQSFRMEQ